MISRSFSSANSRAAGFILLEIPIVIVLMLSIGVVGYVAFQNHREKEHTAEIQKTLYEAALAVEKYAASIEGDYTPLSEESEGVLVEEGFAPPADIEVSISEADSDSYCVTAIHSQLEGDNWGTATLDSAEEMPSSSDTC